MSFEETRYYLNGIFLHSHEEGERPALRAVATDGHRLARIEAELPEGAAGMPGVILPRKAVNEIRKLIEGNVSPCEVELSEAKIRLTIGGAQLISKLIDGTFPDYEKVIPQRNDRLMEVSVKRLAQAIDRIATVTSDKTRIVKFSVAPGVLTISAMGDDNNSGSETLDIAYDGPEIESGFNSRYLLEMLACFESANTEFCYADAAAPVLIRDPGDSDSIFVVMPLKV